MVVKSEKFHDQWTSLRNRFNNLTKRPFYKYGLPFMILIVGGSFGLREWTQIRYQFSQVKGVTKEEAEKMGLNREKNVTLEKAYDEIQQLDIDTWENKRGPRPWEGSNATNKD